jgi:hypothetical protein
MWIISLLTAIPSLISGMFGTINGVSKALSDAKIAAINAKTAEEKIHADEQVSTLQARRDVLIGEAASGSRLNMIIRAGLALGPLAILLKVFLWDKVIGSLAGCSQAAKGTCGQFVTDPLDPNLWNVVTIVLGFYFVSEISLGVSRIFSAKK